MKSASFYQYNLGMKYKDFEICVPFLEVGDDPLA